MHGISWCSSVWCENCRGSDIASCSINLSSTPLTEKRQTHITKEAVARCWNQWRKQQPILNHHKWSNCQGIRCWAAGLLWKSHVSAWLALRLHHPKGPHRSALYHSEAATTHTVTATSMIKVIKCHFKREMTLPIWKAADYGRFEIWVLAGYCFSPRN